MDIAGFLIAVLTLAVGLICGWALCSNRASLTRSSSAAANASLAAERDTIAGERNRLRDEVERFGTERHELSTALRHAELRAQDSATKLAALQENDDQLRDTFARMSNEALARSSAQFLDLADARFKQAGDPITETLSKMALQLGEIERDRVGAQRSLAQQIEFVRTTGEQLRAETATLVSALRKPQTRGRWGELQLKRCLELAGMTARCDFYEQESVTTSDGVLRPDVLVRMSENKTIIIDSKVTLSAYLEAYDATDDAVRDERLVAHAKHLRKHVNDLAAKRYWDQFSPSPEFVVLFVPGDVFLAAALDNDPALLDDAFEKKVHIATPTTLISSLRTIAYTWQQQALADNAQQVFELGRELYKRLGTMGGHVDKLGRSLSRAVNDYNTTVGSLESQVMSSARKLNEMDFVAERLVEIEGLDDTVRPLTKPELVASADDARQIVVLPATDVAQPTLLDGRPEDYGIDASAPRDTSRRTGS